MRSVALGLIGVAILGGGPRQGGVQQPAFRTGTDVVTIDVTVSRRNAPVLGLTRSDFELLDNGVIQAVDLRSADSVPLDITLVVDRTNWTTVAIGARLSADIARIATWLHPADRLRVITFATDVREVLPMQSLRSDQAADLAPSPRVAVTDGLGRDDESGFDARHDPRFRKWSLFDAVLYAIARPPDLDRRNMVIVLTAGTDSGSVFQDGALLATVVSRVDALLYIALHTPRVGGQRLEGLRGRYTRWALTNAAASTGGAVHDFDDAIQGFKSIIENHRRSYLLTYTLKGVAPAGWHAVTVRAPGYPDYEVRARAGYWGR